MDVLGIIGLLIGLAGFGYGVYVKRKADEATRGSIMGADEGPSVMVTRSNNGFNVCLMNESKYPHFDIWVRLYDFATDKIIDTTKFGMAAISDPTVQLPDLYPGMMHGQPFYEIDLRQRDRVRVNLFIHTRNAQSHVGIVALRDAEDTKIAYKLWVGEGKESVKIPENFPIANPDEPNSLFSEDEPTGTTYFKNQIVELVEFPLSEADPK